MEMVKDFWNVHDKNGLGKLISFGMFLLKGKCMGMGSDMASAVVRVRINGNG